MQISGMPRKVNRQLAVIPDLKRYYEELAADPSFVKTGGADGLLDVVKDPSLREIFAHIGRHNALPDSTDVKKLVNGTCEESYRNGEKLGLANLRFLNDLVMVKFMPDTMPSSIRYARQVALVCRGCGEYKATGMFEFPRKDRSYTDQIKFKEHHIIDPNRTKMVSKRRKNRSRKFLYCVPCETHNKSSFEVRYNGPYASARENFYDNAFLPRLESQGKTPPLVVSVRTRVKEIASEWEKLAYQASGRGKEESPHFQILRDNREALEASLGADTLDLLVEDALYDKFGMRLQSPTVEGCYELREWFLRQFKCVREMDWIKNPKDNDYQSIHLTILGNPTDYHVDEKIPIEVQLRTPSMHKVAEHGSAKRTEDKDRQDLIDHKLMLAMTVIRHYIQRL